MKPLNNVPKLWKAHIPKKAGSAHKYDYGHALIYAAPELTGATRLAASACARMGAGLTSVLSTAETAAIYRASLPAHIMVRADLQWFDKRVSARLYGPGGLPVGCKVSLNRPCVLDADALGCLPETLNEQCVLTPHEGEFARAFPNIAGTREERVIAAARDCGAVIVLKGAETLIAHPDGRLAVNKNASPYLASAGTGDVLSGMVTGLLAQGVDGFYAACAAVWMHGQAGQKIGPGLVASDLVEYLPKILRDFV